MLKTSISVADKYKREKLYKMTVYWKLNVYAIFETVRILSTEMFQN